MALGTLKTTKIDVCLLGILIVSLAQQVRKNQNQGKLILDATCAPADIKYPTDLGLLNQAREHTEKIIDVLHTQIQSPVKKNQKPIETQPEKNI